MPNQPRNTYGHFRSFSYAIIDITFESRDEVPLDYDSWLGDGSMIIEFQARGTYRYNGVNFIEFTNFKNAPSWGEYFNNNIRPFYTDYKRIG